MALLQANGTIIRPAKLANGKVILRECRGKLRWEPPKRRVVDNNDAQKVQRLKDTIALADRILYGR